MKIMGLVLSLAIAGLMSSAASAASVIDFGTFSWVNSNPSDSAVKSVGLVPAGTLTGSLTVTMMGDFNSKNETATLFLGSGALTTAGVTTSGMNLGTFGPFGDSSTPANETFSVALSNAQLQSLLSGSDITFGFLTHPFVGAGSLSASLSYAAVPEPTTLAILGLGALGAVAVRRRRK
jgi:hypothetical protein